MRIAYIIPAWPPAVSQPFVVNEMLEVQRAGHSLVVLALYAGKDAAIRHGTYAELNPQTVLPPPLISLQVIGLALLTLITRPWRTFTTLFEAHRAAGTNPWAQLRLLVVMPKALAASWWFRRLGVERLHAHFATNTAECAAIAGQVSGIPYSFTAHAYDIYLRPPRQRNNTLAWKLRHAAQAIGVSDYAVRVMQALLPAEHHAKVHTVYVGIPMALFRAEPPATRGAELQLLCVGRYCGKKGLDTLVDACARLRDRGVAFRLKLFGDGPSRPALAAQIARLNLAGVVALGGPIAQEQVAREMAACHAFVMPCRQEPNGDMDGIPTVFMEAMATGRPVVSCALSGIPELVRDGETGLIVPPNDPDALADAIGRLAVDDTLRIRLGMQGRKLVEREHDQRENTRRLLALFLGSSTTVSHNG